MSIRSGVAKALVILFLVVSIFGGAAYFTYRLFEAPRDMVRRAMGGPEPTPLPDPSLVEYQRCLKVKEGGDLADTRKAFVDFIAEYPDSPKIDEARETLGDINLEMFFSDAPDPGKQQYVIQKGDTISAIERKTKVKGELIMRLNRIADPTKLRIGAILNITRPEFSLKIDHKTKTVVLLNKGTFFKQYKVGEWNAPPRKSIAPATAKVEETSLWKDKQRLPFGAKESEASGGWIVTSATGYTLYTDGVDGVPKPDVGGLGMKAEDIQELSTLINRGTPVTIE